MVYGFNGETMREGVGSIVFGFIYHVFESAIYGRAIWRGCSMR